MPRVQHGRVPAPRRRVPESACDSDELDPTPLSRRGTVWSYTDNRYPPPPPYVAADPFEPYALAAVELADEDMVVLGQVAKGVRAADLRVGHGDGARARVAVRGRRARVPRVSVGSRLHERVNSERDVAVLGVGMHPWGKWGRDFVEYGVVAARAALADAGARVDATSSSSPAPTPSATATPASSPGATFAQALGWTGVRVSSSYAACASGAQALDSARAQILAGLLRRRPGGRRRHHAEGLLRAASAATAPTTPTGCASACSAPPTRPTSRLRPPPHGPLRRDRATTSPQVKVKNARHGLDNPNARYRKEFTATTCSPAPIVADPLRLLEICATSDGGAAIVVVEHGLRPQPARRRPTPCRASRRSPPSRRRYPNTVLELPDFATDSAAVVAAARARVPRLDRRAPRTRRPGIGPDDLDLAEVYDLSTALELDWYENIGLCKRGRGRGAAARRRHRRSAGASR